MGLGLGLVACSSAEDVLAGSLSEMAGVGLAGGGAVGIGSLCVPHNAHIRQSASAATCKYVHFPHAHTSLAFAAPAAGAGPAGAGAVGEAGEVGGGVAGAATASASPLLPAPASWDAPAMGEAVGAGIEGAGAGGAGAGAWLAGTSGLCAAVDAASSGSSPSELGAVSSWAMARRSQTQALASTSRNETSVPTERLIN